MGDLYIQTKKKCKRFINDIVSEIEKRILVSFWNDLSCSHCSGIGYNYTFVFGSGKQVGPAVVKGQTSARLFVVVQRMQQLIFANSVFVPDC